MKNGKMNNDIWFGPLKWDSGDYFLAPEGNSICILSYSCEILIIDSHHPVGLLPGRKEDQLAGKKFLHGRQGVLSAGGCHEVERKRFTGYKGGVYGKHTGILKKILPRTGFNNGFCHWKDH